MQRRELLAGMAAAPLMAMSGPARARNLRRVRPGDPSWPSPGDWAAFGRTLKGELVRPTPILDVCAADAASAACQARIKEIRNPYFLGDQAGGTQVSGWLDAWRPQLSAYAVAAETPQDVAAAVDFARRRNLRLVVKGGGHSYQGTSNAPDSLLVWTRKMRGIALHDAFVPAGCEGVVPPSPAVTVEAGAMWLDVYNAVTTGAGRYVQGGGCATVGVAGLIQSGGFGSFSKRFGAASASLLEAEVVTADGRIRTVNARRDPDLFWALKGGGGGTFGVVTKLTLRTHDLPDRFGGGGATIHAKSDDAFRRLLERFVAFYAAALFNPHWGESVTIRPDNRLQVSMACQGLSGPEAEAVWRPFVEEIKASPADFAFDEPPSFGAVPARHYWDAQSRRGAKSWVFDDRPGAEPNHAWWSGDQEQVSAFLWGYESIWLPADLLKAAAQKRLAEALFAASRHSAIMLHFNKGLAGAPPEHVRAALDTAINPEVARAFTLAIIATGGLPAYPELKLPFDQAAARRSARNIDMATAELRKVAPAAGSYVSESNYFNPAWRTAFWGTHYPRLFAIKRKYDPDGLFTVHHGVGSELWSADGFSRV